MREALAAAVAACGSGPLEEELVRRHFHPLFSRVLGSRSIYLATHSLGRPPDAQEQDLLEGATWCDRPERTRAAWLAEEQRYRTALGALLGAPRVDCVVPRLSAGHALRSVLQLLPTGARVLATRGEFASVAMLLARYAQAGRIRLALHEPDERGLYDAASLADAVTRGAIDGAPFALLVVSHVFYATGQLLANLPALAEACHRRGTQLLVDTYHSLGAVPVDATGIGCDYMIGGCYKYLRGGPGAAFLYLSPDVLAGGASPVDTGWYALEHGTDAWNPQLRAGGDAHLESTPAALVYSQARAGLAFTRALGVDRLRAYSLRQLRLLQTLLADQGIPADGGDERHGAFLTVWVGEEADATAAWLAEQGVVANTAGARLRLCPDCLVTDEELRAAGALVAQRLRARTHCGR